jgi:hypothetical protein
VSDRLPVKLDERCFSNRGSVNKHQLDRVFFTQILLIEANLPIDARYLARSALADAALLFALI